MPDTTVKLQDITPVKSTFDNDDQLLLINPTGEARISKEDFLDAMPDDAITLIGDITTTGIEGDTVAKQLGALENSKATAITDTASGAIANFPDGADDMVMHHVVAEINPVQSGSGDPSPDNIRPITGWTGVNVTRTGKNLFPIQIEPLRAWATDRQDMVAFMNTLKAGTYTLSCVNKILSVRSEPAAAEFLLGVWIRNSALGYQGPLECRTTITSSQEVAGFSATSIKTITITEAMVGNFNHFYLYSGDNRGNAESSFDIQLELGSSATAYEAPQVQTLTVDWQTETGTVYGGTIDVATGLLTVDKGIITINGSESTWNDEGTRFALVMPNTYADSTVGRISIICDTFRPVMSGGTAGDCFGYFNSGKKLLLYFYPLNGENLSQFKSWLSSNNTQVVYPLATPQTYQLTPQQLLTLLGTNNVWADTGDTSVTYAADTKLYIEKLTMPTEDDLVANQAITSGKYFMIGNSLYLALANIASGAQITIGTNAQRVSLADALNTINS